MLPAKQAANLQQISMELPLFERFFELAVAIAQQQSDSPLNAIDLNEVNLADGFIVRPFRTFANGGYWCTPLNTLEFARTGMDGEHFSFLIEGDRIDEQSPIVFTTPMSYGACEGGDNNVILAPNFAVFLGLAIRYGGFALGELAYNPTEALPRFETLSWMPTCDDTAYSNSKQQQALNDIAQHLQISPYAYKPQEFNTLQQQFRPRLIMSQDYLENFED